MPQLQVMFRLAADMSLNPLPTRQTLTFWPSFAFSCIVTPLCYFMLPEPKWIYVSHVNLQYQINKTSKILLIANCRGDMKRPSSIIIHRPFQFISIQKQQAQKSITSRTHAQSTQFILKCCAVVTRNSKVWLSHNTSRMKSQRTCVGMLSWESSPSASWGWADGGSCVNIPLHPGNESDFKPLSHEKWADSVGESV